MRIEARSLGRQFGSGRTAVLALRDASFSVPAGQFLAIMGPSGSGKTTLMNLLGLLDRPTSGSLLFGDTDVTRHSPDRLARLRNREVGFVFQSYNLLPRYTAVENVELPLIYSGVQRRQRRVRAIAALQRVGLANRATHWPAQLSGGEQQRVAIARAVVNQPALVLADEPTGALDTHTGRQVLALFQSMNRAGMTIMMVTHDPQVARHAGRILRLADGCVVGEEYLEAPVDATAEDGTGPGEAFGETASEAASG